MGTKAKCVRCGKEKWVNTSKLKRIHDELGIRPSEWLAKKFVCSDCQLRQRLIKESDVDSITTKVNDFCLLCKKTFNGILQNGHNAQTNLNDQITTKMIELLRQNGLSNPDVEFIKYKKLTIGMSVNLPIVGEFSFMFV